MSRWNSQSMVAALLCSVCATGACRNKSAPPPAPVVAAPTPDAYVPGITTIGAVDPAGAHLDDDPDSPGPLKTFKAPHNARQLEILLRSTPPGALAAVDGVAIGQTPILWEGEFTGREREFTFTLAGYTAARYRFVPTSNGVVHGKLDDVELVVPGAPVGHPHHGGRGDRNAAPGAAPVPAAAPAVAPTAAPPVAPTVPPPSTPPFVATPDAVKTIDAAAVAPATPDASVAPLAPTAPGAPGTPGASL